MNGLDKEEDYVDKCIFVEGQEAPTDVAFGGETIKSSLIGFHVSGMHIHNCGQVVFAAVVEPYMAVVVGAHCISVDRRSNGDLRKTQ